MATLEFLTGKLKGTAEEVGEGTTLIGKSRSSTISVRDLGISFKHAEITFADGKFHIQDLKSKKGTFVNDTQLESGAKAELPDGASLKFGDTEARFSLSGVAAAAPAEQAPAAMADDAPPAIADVPAAAEEAKPEKKLSARERIALRRKQRAEAAAKEAGEKAAEGIKAAGGDEAAAAVVAEKEEEANKAVREVVQLRRQLKEAEGKIAALKSGGAAVEAEAQMESIQRELADKDQMVENLELALSEARAGIGAGDASDDERVQKLEAELASSQEEGLKQKTEAKKLQKALERQAEEASRLKEQASGGTGGYSGAEEENEQLREALNEKTMAMDSQQAEYMEQKELIEKYQRRIDDYNKDQGSRRSTAEKQVTAMEDKIGEYLEQKHSAEKELQRFKKDYEQFEERVIELQASVDDLTERNDIMQYKLEQAEQKVGEIVRGKLMEMQQKAEEVQQANEQLQSLVEAYEEKIDEMDTRIEELEAETEELEKLLEEEREAHEKTKQEASQNERALRKRLQLAVGGKDEAGSEEPVEMEGVTA